MLSKRKLAIIPLVFWLILVAIKLIRTLPLVEGAQLLNSMYTLLITTTLDIVSFAFFYYLIFPKLLNKTQISLNTFFTLVFWGLYSFIWVWIYKITGRAEVYSDFVENGGGRGQDFSAMIRRLGG